MSSVTGFELFGGIPVLAGYQQHPETFAFMFIKMFMMHLMRPPDCFYITVVGPAEPFETLVNDHIVNQEICKTVKCNPEAYCCNPIIFMAEAKHDA